MPTKNARTISFSDGHLGLLEQAARQNRMPLSEVVRRLIDFAICKDLDLSHIVLTEQLRCLNRERRALRQELHRVRKNAKTVLADSVFKAPRTPAKAGNAVEKTPSDLLKHYRGMMGTPNANTRLTPTVRVAMRRIQEILSEHPELKGNVPEIAAIEGLLTGDGKS